MKDLITAILKALVDQPEEVSVNEIGGSHTQKPYGFFSNIELTSFVETYTVEIVNEICRFFDGYSTCICFKIRKTYL